MSIYGEMKGTRKAMTALRAKVRELSEDREGNAVEITKLRTEYENLEDELAGQLSDARAEARADEEWDEADDKADDEDEDEDE